MEWASTPAVDSEGKVTYSKVSIGEGDGAIIVSVGDHVYLTPETVRTNVPCEIVSIKSMFVREDGDKRMAVQWFWRPQHVKNLSTLTGLDQLMDREIFMTVDVTDSAPIEAIERYACPRASRATVRPYPHSPAFLFVCSHCFVSMGGTATG